MRRTSSVRLISLVAVVQAECAVGNAPSPPKIVLVVANDQGHWDTGARGNEKTDMPRIDRLAREGVNSGGAAVTRSAGKACPPSNQR